MDQEVTLQLTQNEKNLFNLFKKFKQEAQLKTVIRVAGGWVRDKVLGKESKDIDIALDDMMGEEFVNKLKAWAENGENKEIMMSGIGVIKSNPENSKNLETATAKVNGYSIDFVNLRSEKYTETSRIPTIEIGTPLEDALRRDFTINSLFYNINTELVEDWTERGLKDLKDEPKLLRTPLDPSVTFKDDPLRIMRCLRFKARFECKVDEEIYKAIEQPDIKEALLKKVSRERIGNELEGLLKAKFFLVGLEDIKDYGLWNIVWKVPEESEISKNAEILKSIPNFSYAVTVQFINSLQKEWKTKKELISEVPEKESPEEVVKEPKQKKEKEEVPKIKQKIQYSENEFQFLLLISSLCYVYKNENVKVGKVKSTLVEYMIKDQLKYPAKVAKFGHHFVETVEKLRQIKSLDNIYPIIRWLRFAEEKWELAIHFLHAVNQIEKTESILNLFQFREWVFERKLDNCYLVQPPVSGDIVLKKGIKGPAISKVLENAAIWKITNPDKNAEQFLEELEKNVEFFMAAETYH